MKTRQRLRAHTSPIAYLGRAALVVIAAALVFYGAMLVLLAFKVSPATIDDVSAYRRAYDYFAGLGPDDITDRVRLIAGLMGAAVFLLCGYLAWKEIPRPYLARSGLDLYEDELSVVTVEPRAIERAAEVAAREHPVVSGAVARYGSEGGLELDVAVRQARDLPETLRDVRARVDESLDRHDLPPVPVSVTLTGFDRKQRRELK